MFIVLLKFAANKGQAAEHMEGHKAWLQRGFDDGVFLLAGSLRPNGNGGVGGGGIVAQGISLEALQERVNEDPFVAENVVSAEIIEMAPSRADARLDFLLAG